MPQKRHPKRSSGPGRCPKGDPLRGSPSIALAGHLGRPTRDLVRPTAISVRQGWPSRIPYSLVKAGPHRSFGRTAIATTRPASPSRPLWVRRVQVLRLRDLRDRFAHKDRPVPSRPDPRNPSARGERALMSLSTCCRVGRLPAFPEARKRVSGKYSLRLRTQHKKTKKNKSTSDSNMYR